MRISIHPGIRIGALLVVSALVACNSSSSSVTSVPQHSTGAVASGDTSTTSSVTLPAVSAAGISSTLQLPVASAVVTVTETASSTPPAGTPALAQARSAQSATRGALAAAPPEPLLYLSIVSSATVTLDGTPGVSFTLPSVAAATSYYLASYGTSGWTYPVAGPGSVSGTTVSFPATTTGTTTLSTTPTIVALYAVSTASSPSPAASAAPPSPSPSPVPVASPASLVFDVNDPTSAPITVTEGGYTGSFSGAIACTATPASPAPSPSPAPSIAPSPSYVAILTASSATATNGSATFTVDSGAELGTCTVTITDANNAATTVSVDVDSSTLSAYGNHRKTR